MKVNTTIKAILMAALAAISYTIPQAQAATAAEMQEALNKVKSSYTDVYALTFTVSEYQTVASQSTTYGQTILQLLPCSSGGTSAGDDGLYLISVYNSSSGVRAIDRVWLSADDNKRRTYKQSGESSIDTALGSVTSSGNTNTYNLTLTSDDYPKSSSYGVLTQGQNHSGITSSITNATYTVAYDGTNTTVQVTTTDNITNKVVFSNTKLDLQNFLFYSGEKGVGDATIKNGTFNSLTDVYTWNGSDALTWSSKSWSLGLADGQSFKSGSDVAFDKEGAAEAHVGNNVTAGNVAVNVDQTIVVEGDNVTFVSTTIADGKTLTLEGGGGTIDLGEVSMVGAKLVVDASEDYLVIQSDNDTLEVATMTIGEDYHVDFFTGNPQVEGTVTITESLTAGGAELYANLKLVGHEGDELVSWDLGGTQMTLGSTLTLDTESGLIQLDNETMLAIAGLTLGEYWELVEDVGTGLRYDGNEWFDGVFSRTYQNEEGLEVQLTGDYKVQLLDNGNFGIVKSSNVPEPTTGTLSLLALMALAARRRKH